MKTIKLKLLARDFKNTKYVSDIPGEKCAIEKAAARQFKVNKNRVVEGVFCLSISGGSNFKNDRNYRHIFYGEKEFNFDKSKANKSKDLNKVIRTITLKQV